MASHKIVEIVEECQVVGQPDSTDQLTLPLTFADLVWFRFPPVERLFFYQYTHLTLPLFNSLVLPHLKNSLSTTLSYFPPVTGRILWPPDSPKPIIFCSSDHGVSFTVAISDADFDHLSSDDIRDSAVLRPYVPKLWVSEDEAATLALQVTLFPSKGFSIGYAGHHAVFDGKSISMFLNAWAYICKHGPNSSLPEELTPVLDRTTIKDPSGNLASLFLKTWEIITQDDAECSKNPRSLNLWSNTGITNTVRSTFVLSREDISKLRQKVLSEVKNVPLHLSTFVLTCAYVLVCRVKARGGDGNRQVWFVFMVDCRARLDPPVPSNYFGNCVTNHVMTAAARDCEAVSDVAARLSDAIKGLENGLLLFEGADKGLLRLKDMGKEIQAFGVAGSTRHGLYGIDYGWGTPRKMEVVSIDRTEAISLAESRDGDGGVEIGLALKRHEMEAFASLFANALEHL